MDAQNRRLTLGMVLMILCVLCATNAAAQTVVRCEEQVKGRPIPPPCIPPETYQNPNRKPPFDVLLRYSRAARIGGQASFIWTKASESSRPCTAAEASNG